ncbi:MAG: aldehyde dehydrogenase family protein [Chloroflexi bacterium]|nr:aldehyde dehydrogenase family protein [Chloroflexota bacterium]|tara:strand:- start:163 stop:1638 length:1476 start_codon:yes stop_codon:yes gene_type:complete
MKGLAMVERYQNYVNGAWTDGSSGQVSTSNNPADLTDCVGEFQASTSADANTAISAAYDKKDGWRRTSGLSRGGYLLKAASYLEGNLEEYAQAITREAGKSIVESRGEVGRAIALLQYYGVEGSNPVGEVVPSVNPEILLYTNRMPLGVISLITPWNFPLAIPIWKMAPALVYGNTIVLKPASATPYVATLIARMWEEVDLPNGVFNLVTGSGGAVGNELITNSKVAAISFTGSTRIGMNIAGESAKRHKRYQLEMGGKNPVIVLPDADLEQAAEITVSGAMKYSGQKCTATSRAIVVGNVIEDFTNLVVEKTEALKIGPGSDPESVVVPVIDQASQENISEMIKRGLADGGVVLTGGEIPSGDIYKKGTFVEPTVINNLDSDSYVACEEIFGPVLSILPATDADEALDIANSVEYGLSAGIFTKNLNSVLDFADKIEAGVVKINGETAGLEPQVPFGGMKASSSGDREQGKAAIEFFTQTKTIYVDRSAT